MNYLTLTLKLTQLEENLKYIFINYKKNYGRFYEKLFIGIG